MAVVRDSRKIKTRIFFEVLGWPAEALTEHLKLALDKLRKTWKISKENYAEPVQFDETNPKLLTTHVEFEAIVPSFSELVLFSMVYGPSVIEIIEPSEIYLTAGEMQDILSDIISKVQSMDKDLKVMASQHKILKEQFDAIKPKDDSAKQIKEPDNNTVKI